MKQKEVPQDNTKTFQGFGTKAVYAVDDNGNYTRVATSGWDVEEVVLRDAVNDFVAQAEQAKGKALNGQTSPLEYLMYKHYMDLELFAKGIGFFKWRVKRHLRPELFAKLSDKVLARYADFFNVSIADLRNFKELLKHDRL